MGALVLALAVVPAERRVSGTFQVRSASRVEVHAPVSGFLRELPAEEGSRVDEGAVVAVIDVPNLATDVRQKQADVVAAKAKVADCESELRQADEQLGRAPRDYALAKRRRDAGVAELDQAKARRNRAIAELDSLTSVQAKTVVRSRAAGVQTLPHLKERLGQYVREGDLICTVEETSSLVAEVKVPEQDVARVLPAQEVEFKARALSFDTFRGVVERVAPTAVPATMPGEVQGNVIVYCLIGRAPAELRPGMSGEVRVSCGRQSVGGRMLEKVMKVVRTEFWW
jgi:multidrug efflux pump subunit AcrA (membrane-fusion protein)